jgi:exopolysaccharide production protein ExoZ
MVRPIQWLRGFAAIMVVYIHEISSLEPRLEPGHFQSIFHWAFGGNAGVDIFFVISGFIMAYTLHEKPVSAREFISKRTVRIAPAYWVCTALLAIPALLLPSLWPNQPPNTDVAYLLKSLFFWPVRDDMGRLHPFLAPGWSLSYEMFFYCVLACSIYLFRRNAVAIAILALLASVGIGALIPTENPLFQLMSDPLILEFIAGMLIARLFLSNVAFQPWVSAGAMLAGVALWCLAISNHWVLMNTANRAFVWGPAASLFVGGAIFLGKSGCWPRAKFPERLGDWSYALYLTHTLAQPVLNRALLRVVPLEHPLFVPLVIVLCVAISAVFYFTVEKPLTATVGRLVAVRPKPQLGSA